MRIPMTWLAAIIVLLQFSLGLGRSIPPPGNTQDLRESDRQEILYDSTKSFDVGVEVVTDLDHWDPFDRNILTFNPDPDIFDRFTWNPPVWPEKPDPDINKRDDDVWNNFESDSRRSMAIGLGTTFAFILLLVVIFVCVRLCCPNALPCGRRILIVATPIDVQPAQTVTTERQHYPPAPPAYDSLQQFPPQYHPPAPPTQQAQYPPAAPNPGFQYSPVQQQYPGAVNSSSAPPLEFHNQVPATSPYGAPQVFK